jgi:prevent-host-death family protein
LFIRQTGSGWGRRGDGLTRRNVKDFVGCVWRDQAAETGAAPRKTERVGSIHECSKGTCGMARVCLEQLEQAGREGLSVDLVCCLVYSRPDSRRTMEVKIHQAKTHLSRLLVRVAAGEEVVISRAGKPVAQLVPFTRPEHDRRAGQDRNRLQIAPDFDAPLPEEIQQDFEG